MSEVRDDGIEQREMRIRAVLMDRFPNSPLLIPARAVADMLGISYRTVHAQVKKNTFFMPYRIIGRSVMIDTEDFVAWYVESRQVIAAMAVADNSLKPRIAAQDAISVDPLKQIIQDICDERERNPTEWLRKTRQRGM